MTQSRDGDWYPDSSGKQGQMNWDGQQWHKGIPEIPRPADHPLVQSISTSPQPRHRRAVTAALCVALAVLAGVVVLAGYLLVQQSSRSQPRTAQPALASERSPSLTTSLGPIPASLYFKTSWGTSCQVTVQQVTCQTCVPGQVITNAYTCTDPAPEVAINTAGMVNHNPGDIGSSPDTQQLANGESYHANGWTIVVSGGWARFINDTTGHGMAVAPQNSNSF
jgi:hypothetical protein